MSSTYIDLPAFTDQHNDTTYHVQATQARIENSAQPKVYVKMPTNHPQVFLQTSGQWKLLDTYAINNKQLQPDEFIEALRDMWQQPFKNNPIPCHREYVR